MTRIERNTSYTRRYKRRFDRIPNGYGTQWWYGQALYRSKCNLIWAER